MTDTEKKPKPAEPEKPIRGALDYADAHAASRITTIASDRPPPPPPSEKKPP